MRKNVFTYSSYLQLRNFVNTKTDSASSDGGCIKPVQTILLFC